MKYYRIRVGVSSGFSNWVYYDLPDSYTVEDVINLYYEEETWVLSTETHSVVCEELCAEDYKHCVQAMKYYSKEVKMLSENIFPVKEWAILLANPNKPVRIGYPNNHMVYRMNSKRELSYQYDYSASKFGVLPQFKKAYPV
ncbi:hypothetical protein ACMG5I_03815 [Escherichia coli]|uniref:hypothetical protein n=1 Tax=Escherichia coli TaxID=562 RepID=UPI0039BF47AF